jgi:hypothetical protein
MHCVFIVALYLAAAILFNYEPRDEDSPRDEDGF